MICVECATPASSLYTYYSDDNITVTKCTNCELFVDKYIECEPILVILDLLLLRPAAVRHFAFNATAENAMVRAQGSPPPKEPLQPVDKPGSFRGRSSFVTTWWDVHVPVFRLIVLAVLFDVYQQWALSEKSDSSHVQRFISIKSPVQQYSMFLALCSIDTFLLHFSVRRMASYLFSWSNGSAISTALLLGSFSKLLPILTFIWHYDMPFVAHIVRYAALFCIIEVLTIILGRGYLASMILTLTGIGVSMAVNHVFWQVVQLVF